MSLVMPIGSILRPTLVNICSRRLKQITFSEAFFSVKVLRKTKLEWFDVVTRLLNNKYSSLRHIYKRGFTSDSADAQTEINFCSILTFETGCLKYSMYVVVWRGGNNKMSLVPLDSCAKRRNCEIYINFPSKSSTSTPNDNIARLRIA